MIDTTPSPQFHAWALRETKTARRVERLMLQIENAINGLREICAAKREEFPQELERVGDGNVYFNLSDVEEAEKELLRLSLIRKTVGEHFDEFTDYNEDDISGDEGED